MGDEVPPVGQLHLKYTIVLTLAFMALLRIKNPESSVAECIAPYLAKPENEKRMVVKQIIQSNADLNPDYQRESLRVTLHSLAAVQSRSP
jgi:hypothetical protein